MPGIRLQRVALVIVALALALAGCTPHGSAGTSGTPSTSKPAVVPAKVPSLRGMSLAETTATLVAARLAIGRVTYDEASTDPTGTVSTQQPAPGASVAASTAVDVAIAGPPPIPTPDIRGLARSRAAAVLAKAGLSFGAVVPSYATTIPAGLVIAQMPAPGNETSRGARVNVIISLGKRPHR